MAQRLGIVSISLFLPGLASAQLESAYLLESAYTLDVLEEEEEGEEKPWSISAELGAVINSGNTDSKSFNGRFGAGYEIAKWRHTLALEATGVEESGVTTKERYLASYKADYKFSARDYWFFALRGERDRFSGYKYQLSESTGYGCRILDTPTQRFDAEIGPGARQSELDDGTEENELIARGAIAYIWHISDTSSFSEDLVVQAGESNTETESVTGLKVKINSSLALKLTYTLKHNSDVPEGNKNTDTITSINLVYDY